jgi:hypothetical protein
MVRVSPLVVASPYRVLRFALVLFTACAACAGMPTTPGADTAVPNGTWGGEHASLTVTDAGAHAEFDCASGDINRPLAVDAEGRLSVDGVVVLEHAGPIRIGEEPVRKPARYSGHLEKKTMTLDVILIESNEHFGSFTLTLDNSPRVRKCR